MAGRLEEAERRARLLLEERGVTSVSKALRGFDEEAVRAAERLGLAEELPRAGYVQVNEEIIRGAMERMLARQGIVVKPLYEALASEPELVEEHYWRALPVDRDVYTALVEVYGGRKGYFVYVPPGVEARQPIYVCLLVTASGETQLLHNIVILGDGASATLITRCGASHGAGRVAHIGATEIYLGRGARLNYVMIHTWTRGSEVRPRTAVVVGEGASYTEYYLSRGGVGILDSLVEAEVGARGRLYSASVIVAERETRYTLRTRARITGEAGSAELVSRILAYRAARVRNEAGIEAAAEAARGHIECMGLPMEGGAVIETLPSLSSRVETAELSHEAAIGRLNEEELNYLMARGLDEEQARALLLRGFLSVEVPGLPASARALIEGVVRTLTERGAY